MTNREISECLGDVMFKRMTGARLAAVLNREGIVDETVDIVSEPHLEALNNDVSLEGPKEEFLSLHPRHNGPVRVIGRAAPVGRCRCTSAFGLYARGGVMSERGVDSGDVGCWNT